MRPLALLLNVQRRANVRRVSTHVALERLSYSRELPWRPNCASHYVPPTMLMLHTAQCCSLCGYLVQQRGLCTAGSVEVPCCDGRRLMSCASTLQVQSSKGARQRLLLAVWMTQGHTWGL
jgi:hypothetical protein